MRRIILAFLVCTAVEEIEAQAPGTIQGSSIERYQQIGSLVVSYRATRYNVGRPGFDLGVGIIPRALAEGVIASTVDLGAAQGAPIGGALLFLRGGVGGLVVTGGGLGGVVPALQGGVALVVPLDPRTAVRLDLGEHLYLVDSTVEPRWSVGIGFAVLPS